MEPLAGHNNFFREIRRSTSQKLIVILLANPENDEIGNYFGRMMECFDELTGKDINFYCAGYNDDYGFNQREYARFIRELQAETSWRNKGGTYMLLIPYANGELRFDTVYDLNLLKMYQEKIIRDYREFIADFINSFTNPEEFIDSTETSLQTKSILNNFVNCMPNIIKRAIKQVGESYKIHEHLKLKDYSKK